MIRIVGVETSREMRAAEALRDLALDHYGDDASNEKLQITLVPSFQCFGESPRDLDLILLLSDQRGEGQLTCSSEGRRFRNLCLVIEVKDHSSLDVRFEGNKCVVFYGHQPHDVTHQSQGQKTSLFRYLKRNLSDEYGIRRAPFVENVIWLSNVPTDNIPEASNVLGSNATWQSFLDKVDQTTQKWSGRDKPYESFDDASHFGAFEALLSKVLTPTRIDRRKMENVVKKKLSEDAQYYSKLGEQLLIFRGRGGTGKTVRLLRMAYQLYHERQLRVLVLTYNVALVSDLTRLLSLLNIRDSVAQNSIAIKTINKFMHQWLEALDVYDPALGYSFSGAYERYKDEALQLVEAGALDREDVQAARIKNSRELAWDIIMIDEAQDWPENERDLLYRLYDPHKFILADGVDQLVRGTNLTNWKEKLPDEKDSQTVPLRKSLRLKSELCTFTKLVAEELEYDNWDLEPIPEAHGGKIILTSGNAMDEGLIQKCLERASADGNRNVDSLFCVPPSLASKEQSESSFVRSLRGWGYEVWDGTDKEEKKTFASSNDQIRVVQYDSCRGLEGWCVFAMSLDKFYEYKFESPMIDKSAREDMFFDEEQAALSFANRWLMIPLTRAIDTLVIHVEDTDNKLASALFSIADRYPEVIELGI